MSKKLTVLCTAAHPDDIELQCAGTLIRYVKEGHKVYMAVACTGNVGSKAHTGQRSRLSALWKPKMLPM